MDRIATRNAADARPDARMTGPKIGLAVTTALASIALAGCSTTGAPPAQASFAKAQGALEKGDVSRAVSHAEAAVLAEPRNPGYRAMLGAAYLEEGRFQSAATSFGEALELGDTDTRTVLSYVLATIATGDNRTAVATLVEWEGAIPPADLGLAYALAGKPQRGVHVLTNAVRAGFSTAKTRQNLAYTYALAGNWRAARVMAAEDVSADKLDERLSDWAATARAEDYALRVGNLLGVTPVRDPGMPAHLALANFPSREERVAQAAASAELDAAAEAQAVQSEARELAFAKDVADPEPLPEPSPVPAEPAEEPIETVDPTPTRVAAMAGPVPPKVEMREAPSAGSGNSVAPRISDKAPIAASIPDDDAIKTEQPTAAPAPAAVTGPRFVSKPVVQDVRASTGPTRVAASGSQRRIAATKAASKPVSGKGDTHLVQLGSYSSRAEAEAGWKTITGKFPQLAAHDVVITEALVKGKTYWRVAAAGFGKADAGTMCRTVKNAGSGCFAYAKTNPPAGAVDRGVRIAARTD